MGHNSNLPLDIQAEFHLANKFLQDLNNGFSNFQNSNKGKVSQNKISQGLKDLGMKGSIKSSFNVPFSVRTMSVFSIMAHSF